LNAQVTFRLKRFPPVWRLKHVVGCLSEKTEKVEGFQSSEPTESLWLVELLFFSQKRGYFRSKYAEMIEAEQNPQWDVPDGVKQVEEEDEG